MPNLIRSVVVDPTLADRLVIRQVEHPEPLPHEAVVKVAAISPQPWRSPSIAKR